MKNQMVYIEKTEEELIVKEYQSKNYYIVKLDGSKIHTLNDYMNAIIAAFKFPDGMFKNINSFDSYNDWMRDLSWIGQYDGYILIINQLDKMMKNDLGSKQIILEEFDETILPFWEEEVLHVVVEGKVKGFNVYLIK